MWRGEGRRDSDSDGGLSSRPGQGNGSLAWFKGPRSELGGLCPSRGTTSATGKALCRSIWKAERNTRRVAMIQHDRRGSSKVGSHARAYKGFEGSDKKFSTYTRNLVARRRGDARGEEPRNGCGNQPASNRTNMDGRRSRSTTESDGWQQTRLATTTGRPRSHRGEGSGRGARGLAAGSHLARVAMLPGSRVRRTENGLGRGVAQLVPARR